MSYDCIELHFVRKANPPQHLASTNNMHCYENTNLEWWKMEVYLLRMLSTLVVASFFFNNMYAKVEQRKFEGKFSLLLHNRHQFQRLWLVLVWNVILNASESNQTMLTMAQYVGWRWIKIKRWAKNKRKSDKKWREWRRKWREKKRAQKHFIRKTPHRHRH